MNVHIGVVSRQNTGNMTPAIQFGAEKFIGIETDFAIEQNWKNGISEVASRHSIQQVELVHISEQKTSDIAYLSDLIYTFCSSYDRVLFNITGGQKPLQLAMWTAFQKRADDGKFDDQAAYVKFIGNKAQIDIWDIVDGKFNYSSVVANVAYSIKDLLNLHGFDIDENHFEALYKSDKRHLSTKKEKVLDLLEYDDFRLFMSEIGFSHPMGESYSSFNNFSEFEVFIKQNLDRIINSLLELLQKGDDFKSYKIALKKSDLKKANKKSREIAKRVNGFAYNRNLLLKIIKLIKSIIYDEHEYPKIALADYPSLKPYYTDTHIPLSNESFKKLTNINKPSYYFEEVIQTRIVDMVLTSEESSISEIAGNVNVFKGASIVGEHDILIATKYGTLISIDAKIFTIEKKDLDARLHNLFNSGGTYAKFIILFPYYAEDFETDNIPIEVKKTIRNLLFQNRTFYVLNNKDHTRTKRVNMKYEKNVDTVALKNFEYILDDLELR